MVHRIYVEKRPGLSPEAGNLLADLRDFLGIRSLAGLNPPAPFQRVPAECSALPEGRGSGSILIKKP